MITRRNFVTGSAALLASGCIPLDAAQNVRAASQFRIIEAAAGGTLGVAIRNTATGQTASYNGTALFPHCSSFKMSLAALVLLQDQRGIVSADERVMWTEDDLMFVSPFTTRRLKDGATLRELAEFTQKYSDNAAANILLKRFGGPQKLTDFWRALGDQTSRLDRTEPALNNVPVGEQRDTTSANAMAGTLSAILFGDTLSQANRDMLKQWMVDTPTGRDRVRKGLPATWIAGDKTGTSLAPGMGSVYVDIGFVEPVGRPPLTFAAYYRARDTHAGMEPAALNVLAEVGRALTRIAQ